MRPQKGKTKVETALALLEEHGPLTTAELGEKMGLTASLVTAVIAKKINKGDVLAEHIPGPGRGHTRLSLNPDPVACSHPAGSMPGQILLALRAGDTEYAQLVERFGSAVSAPLSALKKQGLVSCKDSWGVTYRLTDAGHAACPTRRRNPPKGGCHAQTA